MPTANITSTATQVQGIYTISFSKLLAGVTAADILTDYTINHPFKVLDVRAIVTTAATTAAKAATITAKIGTASVTGISLGLTSANMTPLGAVVSSTATANNIGNAGDKISLTAGSVTSFVEGQAEIVVTIQNLATS